MFSKFRDKLREPFGGKPSIEEDDAQIVKREGGAGAQDPLIAQITNLEGLVSKRTRDLQAVQEQLKQLSATAPAPEEDIALIKAEELFVQPNKAKVEPAVELEEIIPEAAKEPDDLLEIAGREEGKEGGEAEPGDLMSNLFSHEEEEGNPLQGLLSSLPDTTASELLAEAQEITAMMHMPRN